jgi:hypothetical protein
LAVTCRRSASSVIGWHMGGFPYLGDGRARLQRRASCFQKFCMKREPDQEYNENEAIRHNRDSHVVASCQRIRCPIQQEAFEIPGQLHQFFENAEIREDLGVIQAAGVYARRDFVSSAKHASQKRAYFTLFHKLDTGRNADAHYLVISRHGDIRTRLPGRALTAAWFVRCL